MQTVSNTYKKYLETSNSLSPKTKIVVDGVTYLGDVIKTSPKISHSNSSFIGGFPAKTVTFDIYNLNNDLNFENKEIEVYKQAQTGEIKNLLNLEDYTFRGDSNGSSIDFVSENKVVITSGNNPSTWQNRNIVLDLPDGTYSFYVGKCSSTNSGVTDAWKNGGIAINKYVNGVRDTFVSLQAGKSTSFVIENGSGIEYTINFYISFGTAITGENTVTYDEIYMAKENTFSGYTPFNVIEYIKQGVFIPQAKDITNNVSTKVMTISNAQDKTQLLDDKYESSLDWTNNATHTGLEIVQEICTKKSLTLETTNFAWANYPFKQPNFKETTTNREVISRLAEIGGEIALFTSNGGLAIKGQYTTGDTIQRQRYEKLSKENTYIVNTVVLGKDGIDDDIVYPETITGDRIECEILDNPFVDLYREEMISLVANYVIGKSYTPFKIDGFVDGFIYELNDVLSVVDKNGNTFNAVILSYDTSNRIKSNIKAETQDKNTTNYNLTGSKKSAINQVKLEVDHINNTINALSSRIEDLTDYLRTKTGTGSVILNDTIESDGAIGKLSISGFTEMALYPGMVYPSDNVYPGKLTTYIIVQTNGTSTYETYIDLGKPLTSTDELIIENNNVYVKNGSKLTDMNMTVLLKTFEGSTTISVKYFNNVNFTCDYIVENDLTKVFATQAEVSSQFKITNENISSKVTKAEVVSEINQSAEQVKIKANKIALEGIVTANQNFKILQDGSIEAKNGSFTGNIFLQDGNRVIGGDGILTNLQYSSAGVYGGYDVLGFESDGNESGTFASRLKDISLDVYIPNNFTIVEAKVTLFHTPIDWYLYNQSTNNYNEIWGYCRNIKLFKSDGTENYQFIMGYYSEYKLELDTSSLEEMTNALGTNGYTATNTSGSSIQTITSSDIKSYLITGNNKIVVRSTLASPTTESDMLSKSGMARAVINIIGYMSM